MKGVTLVFMGIIYCLVGFPNIEWTNNFCTKDNNVKVIIEGGTIQKRKNSSSGI